MSAKRADYRLRSVTLGGLTSRSTMFVKLAGRDGTLRAQSAAAIANRIQTHDVFAEIEHAAPAAVTRELFRGIATERGKLGIQRQDDRARERARRGFRPVAEVPAHRQRRRSRGAAAARDLHRPGARQTRRHHRQTRRTDAVLPAVARPRSRARRRRCCSGRSSKTPCRRCELAPLRREIEQLVAAQLNEVAALGRTAGRRCHERQAASRRSAYDAERVWRDFPILAREVHGKPLVFLDSAASSQRPTSRDRGGRRLRDGCITPTCIAACTSSARKPPRCSNTRASACAPS